MTAVARFAQRIAKLPEALAILEMHPQGLSLAQLAEETREPAASLREAFLAYYRADVVNTADFKLPVIEFVASNGEEDDPATAEVIRVVEPDPERELGVEHLTAEQLSALYQAGLDLLALEPDNAVLEDALQALRDGLWSAADDESVEHGAQTAQQLNAAARQGRQVRIVYARAWQPGTAE